ncbi:MAG: hypothetical protein IJO03_04445 [Clostridia bacterium]|nr:hypothetical protein [Clostridia bacterium]
MKKALAIILSLVIVICAGVMAFAQGGFVSSPSGNDAPEIEEVSYEDGSCNPRIVVTPYKDRDTLDEEKEEDMNEAYDDIAANEDLSKMCPELGTVAATKGIPVSRLAVSDLFDVSAYHNSDDHEYCGSITVTLSAETLKNFVALLHRNSDGKWNVVPDVIVDYSESTITFSAQDFSPYAVVVDKAADSAPDTGSLSIYIPAIVMVISAVSLAFVLVSLKKKQEA